MISIDALVEVETTMLMPDHHALLSDNAKQNWPALRREAATNFGVK